MSEKKMILALLLLFFTPISFYGQTQQTPDAEDLKRRIIKRVYTDVSDSAKWEIEVSYPELKLEGDKDAVGFNNAAKSLAMKQVEDFKKNMSEFTEEDRKFLPEGTNYSLEISYNIEFLNDELISVNFGRSEYTGGAHPNHWSFTLNYDLEDKKQLKLADLFKPNSGFLEIISNESIKQIAKEQGENADMDWIKQGAGKDLKNFESWNITKDGLKFTFDPYQVGPYAAGGFESLVPFEKFKYEMQKEDFYKVMTASYINGSPPNWCRNGLFTKQNVEFKLAKVKGGTGKTKERIYFYGDDNDCPNGQNCRQKAYIIPGDEVIYSRTYGNFACVWFQPQKGDETVGWVLLDKLSIQTQNKTELNWTGNWNFTGGLIEIKPQKQAGSYKIYGNAIWKGLGDNVHVGEIDYSAVPENNKINVGDGEDEFDCRVKMQRLGKFLIVSDNNKCGGVNVTFDGVYQKKN